MMFDISKYVAITGIGAITPVGIGDDFWPAILRGECGVKPITRFDTTNFDIKNAAEVKGFNPQDFMDRRLVRKTDRVTQLAIASAILAKKDAGLTTDTDVGKGFGTLISSVAGGTSSFQDIHRTMLDRGDKGPKLLDILTVTKTIGSMVSATVAHILGANGICYGITSACATGLHTICAAVDIIRFNKTRRPEDRIYVMYAGASEACITPMGIGGFQQMRILTDEPIIPFCIGRKGFAMGEGCIVLVLEDLEHAINRGAKIIALISGHAANCDTYDPVKPRPDGQSYADCMQMALNNVITGEESMGLNPNEIDVGFPHGCATLLNDSAETKAFHTVFGQRASQIPITSIIPMVGHSLGAVGAMRTAIAALSLRDGIIPPTINYESAEPDPECDLNVVTKATRTNTTKGIVNAFGFGGQNASLVMQKDIN